MTRVLCLVGLTTIFSGCRAQSSTEAPEAPDVTRLRSRYAAATGQLTPATAPLVATGIHAKLGQLAEGQSILGELVGVLGALDGEGGSGGGESVAEGLEAQAEALTFTADGWARIRHVCRGFSGADPPDAAKNGRIDLYGTYATKSEGLDDVVWGTLVRCRLPAGADTRQELDGGVTLDLPSFGRGGGRVALDLTWLDEAGEKVPLVLDFAFDPSGALTVAQELPDATFVLVGLRLDDTAGSILTVDDAAGRWGCRVSVDGKHGECLRTALGAEVGFSW